MQAHPLPPPMRQHLLREIAFRHGRGSLIYTLIPKGEDGCLPPLITPHSRGLPRYREATTIEGVHKGGGFASPFGIRLYKIIPLPRQKGNSFHHSLGAGGGRGWACIKPTTRQARPGGELCKAQLSSGCALDACLTARMRGPPTRVPSDMIFHRKITSTLLRYFLRNLRSWDSVPHPASFLKKA